MTDEAPVDESNTPRKPGDGESWVTVLFGPSERAPGVDDAAATTYRDPEPQHRRRLFLIGGAIVLAVVATVAAIALSAGTGSDSDGRAAVHHRKASRVISTPTSSSTSSTSLPAASTTTAPTTVPTTTPPATTATTTAPPPTPRATADPALPTYQPVPLPAGVGATLTGCSWQSTGSGQYQATGTLTNGPATNHGWTITIHWLQAGREVGQQSAVVDPGPGGAKAWSLAQAAPTPPADPFSCALSVA